MLGVRSVKRDITHACTTLCASRSCLQFLKTTEIEMLDTSSCLHLDEVSFTESVFLLQFEDLHDILLPDSCRT